MADPDGATRVLPSGSATAESGTVPSPSAAPLPSVTATLGRMRVRGFVAVALTIVIGAGAMSGCTSSSGGPGGPGGTGRAGCVPRLTVEPETAHPGDTVTVSSTDVCDGRAPEDGWAVTVAQPIEDGRHVTVRSGDPFDGSWSVPVELPSDFPAGETGVGIDNWDYSSCADNGSCAAVSGVFRVRSETPTPAP